MTAELAMIVPTRGRPGNIRKVLAAWDFTNAWDVAHLVLAVDADDPEYQGYLDLFEETRHPNTREPRFSIYLVPTWRSMVQKLDEAAVALAESRLYFALGFAGDDHLPRTIGWAQTYLAELHRLKTGLVHGDDGFQGANVCTEWAITSDVVRRLGRMIPAQVEHQWCDVSLHDLMKAADALTYLPQVRIEHMHPIVKKVETDDQYDRVNSRQQFRRDKIKYDSWRNGRMSADLATVKSLYPDRPVPQKETKVAKQPAARTWTRLPFPASFKQIQGATPPEIELTLADFAIGVPADQEIVELGVFKGRTSMILAWGASKGNGAHVTGIDAWDLEGNTYGPPFTDPGTRRWADYWVQSLGYSGRVTLVQNFASDEAARWAIAAEEEGRDGRKIGLLFVDDDHSYEGAYRAVTDWAPHLAEGAIIALDDYGHPDWPGVKMAVDDLLDQGVIEPIQIYHDRLAVTRLKRDPVQITAITSEGVAPSPEQVYQEGIESGLSHAEAQEDAWPSEVDTSVSDRMVVADGDLEGVPAGTPVVDLNTVQLRALAKARGISLGTRKDKRSEMLTALEQGK